MQVDPDKNWLSDKIDENFFQLHRIEEVIYSGQTRFQSAKIVRIGGFGKCLVLDGKPQSSARDEFIYHEALVQPAMVMHGQPETVFIAGGGEGATLREVLRHQSVKRAVMVDIDDAVMSLSRKYLPEWSRGAFDDPRAEVYSQDARQWLADSPDLFDVIIIDLPDPLEGGPAYLLYTEEFYHLVRQKLTPQGVISVQAGAASLPQLLCLPAVNRTLSRLFPIVRVSGVDIPCFGTSWGFATASGTIDALSFSSAEIDRRLAQRSLSGLRFYDGVTHTGMFNLPKYVRAALEAETRTISDGRPLFVYTRQ